MNVAQVAMPADPRPTRSPSFAPSPAAGPEAQRAAAQRPVLGPVNEPFGAQVELQLSTCRRHGVGIGVTCIRLLGLAGVGEQLGLGAQRQLVESAQQRLQGRLRHVDKLCAVSLDTFGVALFDVRPQVMPGIEQRLHRVLAAPYRIAGEIVQLQVLVGSALSQHANLSSVELMRRAAEACLSPRA